MQENYYTKIGLEIHIQLKTKTKLFCGCKNEYGVIPNTNVCPVCLGYPGVLPVLNEEAVRMALKVALALNAKINKHSRFYRKNYFYPDLPKGYQITQYSESIAVEAYLDINVNDEIKRIEIERMNIEEEAARSIHTPQGEVLLDFNRSGIPLLEVVTKPCISSPLEAKLFLEKFRDYLRYLKISDCDMEKGELRVDANISLSQNPEIYGTKVELKNLNSFKAVYEALNYERERQEKLLREGRKIHQETRMWDEYSGESRPMRTKEESMDYRYFPEPDLPVLILDEKFIEEVKAEMPELPDRKYTRYIENYKLSPEQAKLIAFDREYSEFFDKIAREVKDKKLVANWLTVIFPAYIGKTCQFEDLEPTEFIRLAHSLEIKEINNNQAKEALTRFFEKGVPLSKSIEEFAESSKKLSEDELERIIDEVLEEQKELVEKYLSGKTGVFQAILGQCMKRLKGSGNPIHVKEILEKKLKG
ncbi:MAG: Asp-tRNA(Asn)/Glu-tRNA(Gln) amidotransferase subunit GatB [bacterium]|nr:Asp-tRNA(Asn)/Glu-tRNA(Gln) amidotransferase subunit GatB [bacterium]